MFSFEVADVANCCTSTQYCNAVSDFPVVIDSFFGCRYRSMLLCVSVFHGATVESNYRTNTKHPDIGTLFLNLQVQQVQFSGPQVPVQSLAWANIQCYYDMCLCRLKQVPRPFKTYCNTLRSSRLLHKLPMRSWASWTAGWLPPSPL